MRFPDVIDKALIAASFLSANSPFLLPQGEEMEARKAHHNFRDMQGDFVSYLNIFKGYTSSPDKEKFCKKNYLDDRVMAEIENIKTKNNAEIYYLLLTKIITINDINLYIQKRIWI